ncbi:MAG: hypothetical protein NTU62_03205 [Spirochaetes bacterium]|nr:hypothetical protein [Spirochaetota bacterium]
MKSRVPVLVVLIVLLAALAGFAADRPVRGSVLVLLKSATAEEDQEFRSLMLSVIRVEIEDRELAVIEPDALPPEGEQPWQSAKEADAEFALVATYTMGQREAAFDLTWYDTSEKKQVQAVTRKASLDFILDVTIAAAVAEILDGQKDRISALPLKPTAAELAAVAPPAEVPVGQVELGEDVVRLEPIKPLLISLGASPLISTFSSAEYIQGLYFGAKAAFAWRFPLLGGAGGLGIVSGFQKYYVTNVGHPGMFYGIPVGGQVQYGTRMPGPIDFFVHFDGGALIWYWDQEDGNLVNGVVWFIAGGVGLVVDILKNLGIAIDVTYAYYPLNPAFTFLEPSVLLLLKL